MGVAFVAMTKGPTANFNHDSTSDHTTIGNDTIHHDQSEIINVFDDNEHTGILQLLMLAEPVSSQCRNINIFTVELGN